MWAEACEALARAERLQRQFFRPGGSGAQVVREPPVDIFEHGPELWIVAALPGVCAERLAIAVDGGVLIIAGDRPAGELRRAGAIHRLEIPHGRFERRVLLPPGTLELTRHELAQGCLTIVLRRVG